MESLAVLIMVVGWASSGHALNNQRYRRIPDEDECLWSKEAKRVNLVNVLKRVGIKK